MNPRNVKPTDIQLLAKQLQIQGEMLSAERIDRETEIHRLRVELQTLKETLDRIIPSFQRHYDQAQKEIESRSVDPEREEILQELSHRA